MMEHLFLTGATGFIGARLLRKWLESSSAHITVLARPQGEIGPAVRLLGMLPSLAPDIDDETIHRRITILDGDLQEPHLGLADDDYRRLADSATHIIHCAAAVHFGLNLEQVSQTNVHGTEEILALAGQCRNLRRFDHLSTAYVAGKRTGLILEEELDRGQNHNNTYEKSKFEAEKLVAAAMNDLPVAILRPSIVVCDTSTGELPLTSVFYRILSMYASGRLTCLPGNPDTKLDIVSVEYVVDGTFALSNGGGSTGRCFHLTAGKDHGTPLAHVVDLACRYFGRAKMVILPPQEFEEAAAAQKHGLGLDEEILNEMRMYAPYLDGALTFDDSNTVAALLGSGLHVPPLESYFCKMVDFINASTLSK
jgi:thioester reductase-like protein